ncbi:hypothetical protein OROHE_000373 [Orobanche hederae]
MLAIMSFTFAGTLLMAPAGGLWGAGNQKNGTYAGQRRMATEHLNEFECYFYSNLNLTVLSKSPLIDEQLPITSFF